MLELGKVSVETKAKGGTEFELIVPQFEYKP